MGTGRPIAVKATRAGAVRLSADLIPEESRNGAYVRDTDTVTARRIAIEILQAAEEADRIAASR